MLNALLDKTEAERASYRAALLRIAAHGDDVNCDGSCAIGIVQDAREALAGHTQVDTENPRPSG